MLLVSAALADCPAISPALDAAREALLDERLELVESNLSSVEASFLCAPVYPDQLARYYLLSGALRQLRQQDDPTPYYTASRRLVPEPDLQLGTDIVAAFRAAPEPTGQASLTLSPGQSAWIDGKPVPEGPVMLVPGFHFVQVRDDADAVLFARQLSLEADQALTVETGLAPAIAEEPKKPHRFPGFLVTGVALAGAGTGAALLAMQQNDRIEAAYQACVTEGAGGSCEESAFYQAGKNGDVLTAGAYALWGLGAAGIVLEFVVPVREK